MSVEKSYSTLIAPIFSEKASNAAERGQYVFRVRTSATKREIKVAVETIFDVKVNAVSVLNVKAKQKRFGRHVGKRSAWKKAYVSLASGQTIDFTSI
jgi:large subunit ribosomal protein L23